MKKVVFIAIIVSLAMVGLTWAQDVTPVPKQQTIEELQWKAMYLQEHIKALQADFQNTQDQLKQVQAELKARQPAPAPKVPEKSKDEANKDDKKPKK